MIHFQEISKTFKYNFWDKEFKALDNVSFSINEGELVGFLGANGAGKTTLIKILMDFSRSDSGQVVFSEKMGKTPNQIRASLGYLPEKAYLYQHLTGREFLEYTGSLNGIRKNQLNDLILSWAERMQIAYALDRRIHGYSKGMQQRLGFISSLIHRPKILILDEPLSGLDPVGRRDFKNILKDLNNEGITIFFSSHIVPDVEEICQKVIFIEKGKLIYEGSIDELVLKNSNDLYRVKYLDNDKIESILVHEKDKHDTLSGLIQQKVNIIEIEKEKPSLEEIIYKIKK
ncbi:MAG: ABC transporter ATP-binding protein [Bacteriovorax sp.]